TCKCGPRDCFCTAANVHFLANARGNLSFYAAAAAFRARRRLTAFAFARNIVCIRTKWTVRQFDGQGCLTMTDTTSATTGDKIRSDACPIMCYIKPGAAGACDRYANHDGQLVRVDPHIILEHTVSHGGRVVPFQATGDWDGKIVHAPSTFVTAIGAGTTY